MLSRSIIDCLYPSGAVFDNGRWLVSFGYQDDFCCLASVDHASLLAGSRPR